MRFIQLSPDSDEQSGKNHLAQDRKTGTFLQREASESTVFADRRNSFFEGESRQMRQIKVIVERHEDGYVAYPVGLRGSVAGEGDSYEEAAANITSAIKFHI